MAQFNYSALTATGETSSGVMTAPSRFAALQVLTKQALVPLKLEEKSGLRGGWSRRCSPVVVASAYEQLADLLDSGVPLLRSIDILGEQTSDTPIASVLAEVRTDVANGQPLADALSAFPETFSKLSVTILHAGEQGGFLESALRRVATYAEREQELRSEIVGAMAYPCLVLLTGIVVVTGMMTFFVPSFEPLFARMRDRGELPLATECLLSASAFLQSHFLWIAAVLCGLAFAAYRYLKSESGELWLDRAKLNVFGLGPIVRGFAIARFCRVLGTLLGNGVPILKALEIARDSTGNRVLSSAIAAAGRNVSTGKSLAGPLSESGQFPADVLEVVRTAEQSNRLDATLVDIAEKLDRRNERKLKTVVQLLEPGLMIVMAITIGFLVIALLLPVFTSSGI